MAGLVPLPSPPSDWNAQCVLLGTVAFTAPSSRCRCWLEGVPDPGDSTHSWEDRGRWVRCSGPPGVHTPALLLSAPRGHSPRPGGSGALLEAGDWRRGCDGEGLPEGAGLGGQTAAARKAREPGRERGVAAAEPEPPVPPALPRAARLRGHAGSGPDGGPRREAPPPSCPGGRAGRRCFNRNKVVTKSLGLAGVAAAPGSRRCSVRRLGSRRSRGDAGVPDRTAAPAHGDPPGPPGSRPRAGRWAGHEQRACAAPGVYLKLGPRPPGCLCEPGNAGEGPAGAGEGRPESRYRGRLGAGRRAQPSGAATTGARGRPGTHRTRPAPQPHTRFWPQTRHRLPGVPAPGPAPALDPDPGPRTPAPILDLGPQPRSVTPDPGP